MGDKARGWLDHARRAHSHEDRAFIEGTEDAIQLERHLAEPTDVRANPTAAVAPAKLGWRIVGVRVEERRSAACVTAAFEQFAVHVNDALRPGLLVQVVHVLGAEEYAIFQLLLQFCEREVRRVGLCRSGDSTAHRVELPDQPGITTPSMGRGYFLNPVVSPESAATECRNSALGAHACACEDEDAITGRDGEHG